MTKQTRLIEGLVHSLERQGLEVSQRETHISWILLAGNRAYKIKKEVDFGFLDFSSLEKRKHACEEELRLNRRFAPEIYRTVVPICGSQGQPQFGGDTEPLEYAVQMQRFDESGLLSELATRHQLESRHIDAAAKRVAEIHRRAAVAPANSHWGRPDQVWHWLEESFEHIERLCHQPQEAQQIAKIRQLAQALNERRRPVFERRNSQGYIRECHGDLHLRNMVWIEEQLVPFDCIEFNPALRWIDIISEAAFVMMDLEDRGYTDYAWRFINLYLSYTGDYSGLELLPYYLTYRALVRAKVCLLQRSEQETSTSEKTRLYSQYQVYIALAQHYLCQNRPALMIMHGLSASGKSTIAGRLLELYHCITLRSDVERKRIYGLEGLESSKAQLDTGIYSKASGEKTYQRLLDLSRTLLKAGFPVLVDAAFLQRSRRDKFHQLADELDIPFLIVHCQANPKTLEKRIIERTQRGNDPSEATLAVLRKQLQTEEKLCDDEHSIFVSDTDTPSLPEYFAEHLA